MRLFVRFLANNSDFSQSRIEQPVMLKRLQFSRTMTGFGVAYTFDARAAEDAIRAVAKQQGVFGLSASWR